jgi:hypothetical protein
MARPRRGALRTLGALFLVGLLLAPVALSGHRHETGRSEECAVCTAAHHSPLAAAAPLPDVGVAPERWTVGVAGIERPAAVFQLPSGSRAPPPRFTAYRA